MIAFSFGSDRPAAPEHLRACVSSHRRGDRRASRARGCTRLARRWRSRRCPPEDLAPRSREIPMHPCDRFGPTMPTPSPPRSCPSAMKLRADAEHASRTRTTVIASHASYFAVRGSSSAGRSARSFASRSRRSSIVTSAIESALATGRAGVNPRCTGVAIIRARRGGCAARRCPRAASPVAEDAPDAGARDRVAQARAQRRGVDGALAVSVLIRVPLGGERAGERSQVRLMMTKRASRAPPRADSCCR